MAFLLDFFAAGAELIARTGGFLPLAAGLALILFLSASIKSITGAALRVHRSGHFLAFLFRGDHRPHAFLVLVAIFRGSNVAARLSISCTASFFSCSLGSTLSWCLNSATSRISL